MAKGEKKESGNGVEDIIKAINTLAATARQNQEQIKGIVGVLAASGTRDKVSSEFGSDGEIVEGGGEGSNGAEPTYPHLLDQGGEAKMELVKLCFDTPADKLPELTETPRMEVTPISFVEAMEEFIANMCTDHYEPLDSIFIRRKDRRMKSVSRKSLLEALAFSQIIEEKKTLEEGQQAGF